MEPTAAQIPEDLMQELHQASERFHECRRRWEQVMDGSDYRHQERTDAAAAELHQAEREVEALEGKIQALLSGGK